MRSASVQLPYAHVHTYTYETHEASNQENLYPSLVYAHTHTQLKAKEKEPQHIHTHYDHYAGGIGQQGQSLGPRKLVSMRHPPHSVSSIDRQLKTIIAISIRSHLWSITEIVLTARTAFVHKQYAYTCTHTK